MTNEVLQKTASDEQNVSSSNGLEPLPKLRFLEFKNTYKKTKLNEAVERIQRRDPTSEAPVMMLSAASGFIMQSEKYSRENAGQSLKKYILLRKGELAYNHGASKYKPFGCCFELKEDEARIPYVYHCFAVKENNDKSYIARLLNNQKIDQQLKRLISSSVRMDGLLNISYEEYTGIDLYLPSLLEQQKIADFLFLVDRRIEKQRQLVESLKKYKRGALSRVFNDVLETVKLSDISNFISSARTLSTTLNGNKGIYPVYDAAGIAGYIDYYDIDSDYITIVKDGSGVGRLQKCDKKSSFIGTLGALVAKNCTTDFLYAVLQTIDFSKFVTGMAIPHIYYRDYKSTLLPFPSEEKQHFISQLLKKFDIYIENETQKLTNMLAYKQGLLQQMFI